MDAVAQHPQSTPSRKRRVFYAFSGIVVVMVVGIVGFHELEGMDWVNAIYFESMLATGQGPPLALTTDAGKLFASVMAFVSVGSVITALVVTLIPLISQLWREGLEGAERDVKALEKDLTRKNEKPEE
jgi:predicted histidine transporter YuiF (NhaC family)